MSLRHIDFSRPARSASKAGWVLLALGILALIACAFAHQQWAAARESALQQAEREAEAVRARLAATAVVPLPTVSARPVVPASFDIVARFGADELHVTLVVTSCVVQSLNTPVATNWTSLPSAADGFAGVT